ncbi:MAG: response regulator [Nitrospinae bacterium]|nr:response regulator [Nitrospinota bacterium]
MLRNKTVLVVEDSALMRHFIVSMLRNQLNCQNILQAASGDEAMEMLKSSHRKAMVDIILSDWEMPGMTGDEFLFAIREHEESKDIPFIMVTARNDRDSIIIAAQAGVSDYIVKPFSATALVQKIQKVLGASDRRAMARFRSATGDKVVVVFGKHTKYDATLISLSQTGIALRTPLFKHGVVCVYDTVDIELGVADEEIRLKAELIRTEADKYDQYAHSFMIAGFHIQEISDADANKLRKVLSTLPPEKSDYPWAPKPDAGDAIKKQSAEPELGKLGVDI